MPEASTSATNVAIGGSTGAGCAAVSTATGAGTAEVVGVTGVGTTDVDDVVGTGVGVTGAAGADVVGVVVPACFAPAMLLGVVRATRGLNECTDGARCRSTARNVVTAKTEAKPTATIRTGR